MIKLIIKDRMLILCCQQHRLGVMSGRFIVVLIHDHNIQTWNIEYVMPSSPLR